MSTNGRPKHVDLVFEGGGVKGIGLAGAYSVLEEDGWQPQNLAGASAGAINAALVAAGYTSAELMEILLELDFREFQDRGWEDRLPAFEKTFSLLKDLGIYEGEFFEDWMRDRLAAKGVRTFGDLVRDHDEEDLRYRWKLQVIASDVTQRAMLVLPRDAEKVGVEPDKLDVAYAVRMSMSIPVFFEPVRHLNEETNRRHTIVDGGMLSNFPVWLFDCETGEPDWPTFGLLLMEKKPDESIAERLPAPEEGTRGVGALVDYLKSLAQTMMEAHDRLYLAKADYARTIGIDTLGVGTTEFDLSRERALELYESGRTAARKFLDGWDFDGYIAAYRSGRKVSRRREVVEEMREAAAAVS